MVMATTSLADAKSHLSEIVKSAETTHERTIVTKNGRPVVAIISIEDLESLEETLEIMSDPTLMAQIRQARTELARGAGTSPSKDEMLGLVRGRTKHP
jgi:antitoxin YefM